MAESLVHILQQLESEIGELAAHNARLLARNKQFEAENADLVSKAREAEEERDRARLDADFLAVSHKLADNPDNLIATRRRIAQLIRNIDRCLEMLKE